MPKQIKDALGLDNKVNHGFVNGYVKEDIKRYIDYKSINLFRNIKGFDSQKAHDKIIDFFSYNYKLSGNDFSKISSNMMIHENNDTHFGNTKRGSESSGKGPSYDSLMTIFDQIRRKSLKLTDFNEPMDILLFTPRIGPDYFSDLITNIIYMELYNYTEYILEKYNAKSKVNINHKEIAYWDNINHKWTKKTINGFYIGKEGFVLVPTKISTKHFYYSVDNMIKKIFIEAIQEQEKKSKKKKVRNKKDIRKELLVSYKGENNISKSFLIDKISKNKSLLNKYHQITDTQSSVPLKNDNDIM